MIPSEPARRGLFDGCCACASDFGPSPYSLMPRAKAEKEEAHTRHDCINLARGRHCKPHDAGSSGGKHSDKRD
jgi:hypothetical protein